MIGLAYRPVQEFAGGPDWINTAHFDIEARTDGNPSQEQMLEMLRTLLADRFKLVVHKEMIDSPVYALTLARRDGRLGPRMRRAERNARRLAARHRHRKDPSGDAGSNSVTVP